MVQQFFSAQAHACAADRSVWLREPEVQVEVELHIQGDWVSVELCEVALRVEVLGCAFDEELLEL